MKKILIAALLVLPLACDKMDLSPEQADSFIRFFNTFPVLTGADVRETPAGYAVVGNAETFTDGSQICLALTDRFGNLMDSIRYFGRSGEDQAFGLQTLSDGGLAILGTSENPSTGYKEVMLIRTNAAGEAEWTRYFKGTRDVEARHFEVNSSGNFYLAGYVDTVKSVGAVDKDIWLFGLDADGSPLSNWPRPRRIGGEGADVANCLQLLEDGRIVLTGVTKSYPNSSYNHSFLLITSSIGSVSYAGWINSDRDEEGHCIRSLGNNDFLLIGTSKNTTEGTGADVMLKKVNTSSPAIRVDLNQNFSESGNDTGKDVLVFDNSYYLLADIASGPNNSRMALIRTTDTGSNPEYTFFGESSQMISGSMIRSTDGRLIITGTNKHPENSSSMTLIKVNPDGSF